MEIQVTHCQIAYGAVDAMRGRMDSAENRLVLLDRGAEMVEFRYKPLDLDPLLRLPGELRNPARDQPSVGAAGGAFLDYYAGGWQEILPNGGQPAVHRGAEYGQHGEVSLVPWSSEVTEDSSERIALRCTVRALRTPLLLERTMMLERGRAVLTLDERLTSEAGDKLRSRIPSRRFAELTDLDGPLLLLASDAGAAMSGSTVAVDGAHLVSSL